MEVANLRPLYVKGVLSFNSPFPFLLLDIGSVLLIVELQMLIFLCYFVIYFGVNFFTGINDSVLRSLHFCELDLTVSHQDVIFFTVVNGSGLMTSLYFRKFFKFACLWNYFPKCDS